MARPDRRHDHPSRALVLDARLHLAHLAGKTLIGVLDGQPYRILGVTRDEVFVLMHGAPLGKPVAVSQCQTALDRLARGEEVELSDPSLGEDGAFLSAMMLSLPDSELLHGPVRVRLRVS